MKKITVVFLVLSAAFHFSGTIPFKTRLDEAAVKLNKINDIAEESLIIGNGDINALVYEKDGTLVLQVTKNDVWDSRLNTEDDPPLPTLELVKHHFSSLDPDDDTHYGDRGYILPDGYDKQIIDSYSRSSNPCPRIVGLVSIGSEAAQGDYAGQSVKLDIRKGYVSITNKSKNRVSADIRALMQNNVFLVETSEELEFISLPLPDPDYPPARKAGVDGVIIYYQHIPGDKDWPGMSYAMALAKDGNRNAVSVVTSLDSPNPEYDAVKLAKSVLAQSSSRLKADHEREWEKFWSASGIDIEESELSKVWYRNLYFFRCVSKPGVQSVGLFAGLFDNSPMWHGDYHTNYNIQQTYWSAFSSNHPDLAEPYDRLISEYLPRAKWLTNQIYGMDGAFYPHVLYAYEPSYPELCKSKNGRQYFHHVWGMTLGVTGFTVQPLWWRYKYQPDMEYLQEVVWPVVREVATFYANFVENCKIQADGRIELMPTVSPEHWGWTPQFLRNKDCSFDIAMFRYIFEAAIEAATILNEDPAMVARFQKCISLLPEYPRTEGENPVIVDVKGAPPINYNITVPTTPVFPGDVINYWSSAEDKEIFTRTIEGISWNGNNADAMLAIARARLSIPGSLGWFRREVDLRTRPNGTLSIAPRGARFNDFGHYTEQFGYCKAINEFLVQSVGDIIRIFPAWDDDKDARFRNFRCQGGFLVSSDFIDGKVTYLMIDATANGELKLLSPWETIYVRKNGSGKEKLKMDDKGIVTMDAYEGDSFIYTYQ